MGTETRNKGTIFCTKEQFDTLMSTGSVTIDGTTYTYEDGFIYAVVDKDYVDLTSDQGIEGTKTFIDATNNKSIGINGSGFINKVGNTEYDIELPSQNGTLAVTGDIKKYYLHTVFAYSTPVDDAPDFVIQGYYISSRSTALSASEFVAMSASEKEELLSRIVGKFYSPANDARYVYSPQYRADTEMGDIEVSGIIGGTGISEFTYTIISTDNMSWDEITDPVKEL